MINTWFAKEETTDSRFNGSENGNGNSRPTERNGQLKRPLDPRQSAMDSPDRNAHKPATPLNPPTFEQIYQTAAVKPPKLPYGIQKVAEMAESAHLAGMSPALKQKALLMALEATGTDVGEILKDMVARRRALKEYEDAWLERVTQFEAAQLEQNRLQQAELDKITSQYRARIAASLAEVERWHREFREWQKSKQQELQRLTDAANLCVPNEKGEVDGEQSDTTITAIPLRVTGTDR